MGQTTTTTGAGASFTASTADQKTGADEHDVRLTVSRVRTDPDGRGVYACTIADHHSGAQLYRSEDLFTGCYMDHGPRFALGQFAGFLAAAAESYAYAGEDGENAGMYPLPVVQRAQLVADELSMLTWDCERDDDSDD
jgi:hypothetical protein